MASNGKAQKELQVSEEDPLRVLVVEDIPDVAEGMELILRLWGHEVKVAHEGTEAIRQAPQFHPDVILLDIGLPGLSGYDLARHFRRLPQFKHTTLIALTGYGQPADREQAFAAGFDHHLVKGGSLDTLKCLLQR